MNIKNILLHKSSGSGMVNYLIGLMLILMVTCFIYSQSIYTKNIINANYVEDGITLSLLGSLLINPFEYGASNQTVIYDILQNHTYGGNSYLRYVDGILINNPDPREQWINTYVFNSINEIVALGNLADTNISGDFGPIQSYTKFKQLLKTNLGLDDNMVPIKNNFLPKEDGIGNLNKVKIKTYKVYNRFEFMVKAPGYDDELNKTKPLTSTSGAVKATCNSSGVPLYNSYEELKEADLVHSKVVCYTIEENMGTPIIKDVKMFDTNDTVYVTDENGNEVYGEDGKKAEVEYTCMYCKISFYINLGKEQLGMSDTYTLVDKDKLVFMNTR